MVISNYIMEVTAQWTDFCPFCHLKTLEIYDAPSCLDYSEICENCGYKSNLEYRENEEGELELKKKNE